MLWSRQSNERRFWAKMDRLPYVREYVTDPADVQPENVRQSYIYQRALKTPDINTSLDAYDTKWFSHPQASVSHVLHEMATLAAQKLDHIIRNAVNVNMRYLGYDNLANNQICALKAFLKVIREDYKNFDLDRHAAARLGERCQFAELLCNRSDQEHIAAGFPPWSATWFETLVESHGGNIKEIVWANPFYSCAKRDIWIPLNDELRRYWWCMIDYWN